MDVAENAVVSDGLGREWVAAPRRLPWLEREGLAPGEVEVRLVGFQVCDGNGTWEYRVQGRTFGWTRKVSTPFMRRPCPTCGSDVETPLWDGEVVWPLERLGLRPLPAASGEDGACGVCLGAGKVYRAQGSSGLPYPVPRQVVCACCAGTGVAPASGEGSDA